MLWLADTARNSNLLPVNANGLVRLRSPASLGSLGSTLTPISMKPPCLVDFAPPFSSWSIMSDSWSPRNTDMMAGGASLAPSRWSLAAPHTDTRSNSGYLATARITAQQKTRNWALSCGVSPGLSRFSPRSVDIDQLLCLPEPLMPANGFSWNSVTRPYFGAMRRMTSIVSCWWSVARLHSSKMGASSYWLGATSLWRVLTGTPSLVNSVSQSAMQAMTRSGM